MITLLAEKEYLTPPDNESVPVTKCFFCCETIYSGDEFYKLDGLNYCEDCLDKHFKVTAEPPDWEAEKSDLAYHDDCQICRVYLVKMYAKTPGIRVLQRRKRGL